MAIADWPRRGREVILVVIDADCAIDWESSVCAFAGDQEYLLVDLRDNISVYGAIERPMLPTHDPSDTDSTLGARGDVAGVCLGKLSPL